MAWLRPDLRGKRLSLDYDLMQQLHALALTSLRGFASEADRRAGRCVTSAEGAAGRAVLYEVVLAMPVLIGAGRTSTGVTLKIDLLAGGNYPYSEPLTYIVSRPMPWSPHVQPATGLFCAGEMWRESHGRMLAAQYVVHAMRALNCDETDRGPGYDGWNAAAINYWRTELGCRPLTPDLEYPRLPVEITHGVAASSPVPALDAPAPEEVLFTPLALDPPTPAADDGFLALGGEPLPEPVFVRLDGCQ